MDTHFVQDWGSPEFTDHDRAVYSYLGEVRKPGGVSAFPVSIMSSPAGLSTYNRGLVGRDKAMALDAAFGDWIYMRAPEFKALIKEGLTISWVCILFGARAFNFLDHFRHHVSTDYTPGTIVLKQQRKENPASECGWEIACWGYAPDFDTTAPFSPMSDKEKKSYPFVSQQDIIAGRGIEYFTADVLVIGEGAGASGETLESTLLDIFETLKNHGKPLPRYIYLYMNFGSVLTALRAHRVCENYGVTMSFTFMGSAIAVSPEGVLPGLPYTDLPHLSQKSITCKELYERDLDIATDMDGQQVRLRCSCGDVGESLDNPEHYLLLLVLENLILRIPLHNENLMQYYRNPQFRNALKREIRQIENKHGIRLKNTKGEAIQDVIAWHEQKGDDDLNSALDGTGSWNVMDLL
ncbi:MAG: hypothetical protein AB9903_23095 [Vulcanimicrobiota bacterium]